MRGLSVLLFLGAIAVASAQVNECPIDQATDWTIEQLLRHDDCNKFYKCTFGQPVEYTCYDELYFNLDTWQCDWPHNVDCEGRNDPALTTTEPPTPEPTTPEPTSPEPTTPEPTTPEPTTPEPTTPEPTTPEPTTPEPTTPEPTTPEPTTPEPTAAPTAAPTTKNPGCEVEVWPETEPHTEVPGGDEDGFLANGCPVDPHVHWLVPNAEDCNLFYYCVWGELVLRECPATLHFNPVLQVCDWPNAAGCTVSVNKHADARRRLLQKIFS